MGGWGPPFLCCSPALLRWFTYDGCTMVHNSVVVMEAGTHSLEEGNSVVETKQKPPFHEMHSEDPLLHQYWSSFEILLLRDGVLYHQMNDSNPWVLRLVAPPKVRTGIFLFLHNNKTGGHLGITKTVPSAKQRIWWPGMKADVKHWGQLLISLVSLKKLIMAAR